MGVWTFSFHTPAQRTQSTLDLTLLCSLVWSDNSLTGSWPKLAATALWDPEPGGCPGDSGNHHFPNAQADRSTGPTGTAHGVEGMDESYKSRNNRANDSKLEVNRGGICGKYSIYALGDKTSVQLQATSMDNSATGIGSPARWSARVRLRAVARKPAMTLLARWFNEKKITGSLRSDNLVQLCKLHCKTPKKFTCQSIQSQERELHKRQRHSGLNEWFGCHHWVSLESPPPANIPLLCRL